MYVITYSLKKGETNSDRFYQDIAVFTDEILSEIDCLTRMNIEKYIAFLKKKGNEEIYSKEEYGFEFLVLGVLWQAYSGDATELDAAPKQILSQLGKMREQGGSFKPSIDFLRGILSTIFLSPDLYDNLFVLEANLKNMGMLMNWLEATGEFKYEVKRLRKWHEYLTTLSVKEISEILTASITLAAWFNVRSEEVLGRYTPNVERYLNEQRPERYWREDVIFCGRRRVEYHLNMVGAEVMNRAYRKAFVKTAKKVVVLPACMRLLPDAKCKANSGQCMRCIADCNVNHLTKLSMEHGFDVVTIPHKSSISAGRDENSFLEKDVGVIGVACVLNLISGGWMLKEMEIPAQCVILDYCGCKNHWSKEGFPTSINIRQIKTILGI